MVIQPELLPGPPGEGGIAILIMDTIRHGNRLRSRSFSPPRPQPRHQQHPAQHCSYSCIYCQIGPTAAQEVTPREFYSLQEIRCQVEQRLQAVRARGEAVDCLTFVPDGEPTLDSQLGKAIDSLRDLGLPIAVISNATLIGREDVRAVLNRAGVGQALTLSAA